MSTCRWVAAPSFWFEPAAPAVPLAKAGRLALNSSEPEPGMELPNRAARHSQSHAQSQRLTQPSFWNQNDKQLFCSGSDRNILHTVKGCETLRRLIQCVAIPKSVSQDSTNCVTIRHLQRLLMFICVQRVSISELSQDLHLTNCPVDGFENPSTPAPRKGMWGRRVAPNVEMWMWG